MKDNTLKIYDFVGEMSNSVTARFDIQSLLTSIPLDEIIEIITNGLHWDSLDYMNFTREQLKKLIQIAIEKSPFIFYNKLYIQTDGVVIDSCLGPSLANASFFMLSWRQMDFWLLWLLQTSDV